MKEREPNGYDESTYCDLYSSITQNLSQIHYILKIKEYWNTTTLIALKICDGEIVNSNRIRKQYQNKI